MKGRLTLYLVLAGTAMLLIGVITTVALIINRANCDGISTASVCQGYTNSLHWAYPVIALGAICFIAAGLSVTNLVPGHQRKNLPVGPTATEDRQGILD